MSASRKSPTSIRLKQINFENVTQTPSEPTFLSLAEKIEEYIFRLGFSNAYTSSIVGQLLSVGKIRVDFRDHAERLQLLSADDLMSKSEAVALSEDFISHLSQKSGHSPDPSNFEMTQRIIVQPPKPNRS